MGSKQIQDFDLVSLSSGDSLVVQTSTGAYKRFVGYVVTNLGTRVTALESMGMTNSVDKSTSYTVLDDDGLGIFIVKSSGGDVTITLPTLADNAGRRISVFEASTSNKAIVAGEGAETIDGLASVYLPRYGNFITVTAESTFWRIVDEAITAQLRLNSYAGYGGTDTRIVRFTNLVENTGNMFTENHTSGYNSTAEGLSITVNRQGKYFFAYSHNNGVGGYLNYGLSIDSTQLTTNIQSILAARRLAMGSPANTYNDSVSITIDLQRGQVVRFHADAGAGSTVDSAHVCYLGQ